MKILLDLEMHAKDKKSRRLLLKLVQMVLVLSKVLGFVNILAANQEFFNKYGLFFLERTISMTL